MGKKSRRRPPVSARAEGAPVAVVGGREACPCGSGKRYRLCHGRAERENATRLVARPFAGLAGECDWIALREIVPAATATVTTTAQHGAAAITVATVLPMALPAMRRQDGSVILGLQTAGGSGDPSRDAAAALLRALAAEPGTPVPEGDLVGSGPRLQEVLDTAQPFEVTVHPGFDFWLHPDQEVGPDLRESMERANATVTPTARLTSVEAAYWFRINDRCHLRWVLPHDEAAVLDALARLHAAGASSILDGGRYVGSFRADGVLVPVWDLPITTEAAELEEPAKEFAARLEEAMASSAPLTVP
ncbi:MAG TPA: DUF5926 family protein, partial [Kineosporiaceae bacterium]